ncbi:MAG: hypothetical protein MZV70_47115 [Desulfobacterales bacterium]|nr:hypothetical protein [Desulfobacterales bacterium]
MRLIAKLKLNRIGKRMMENRNVAFELRRRDSWSPSPRAAPRWTAGRGTWTTSSPTRCCPRCRRRSSPAWPGARRSRKVKVDLDGAGFRFMIS